MKTSTLSGTFSTFEDDIWTSRRWLKLEQSTNVPYDRREECQPRMDGYSSGKDQKLGTTDDAASLKFLTSLNFR